MLDVKFSGEWVEAYMKELGITRKTMAERIGTRPCELRRYLKGEYTPKLKYLARIADVLGCKIDDLVEEVE